MFKKGASNPFTKGYQDSELDVLMRLQKVLTCSLCYNNYHEPKTLPCQHSFCLACLRQIAGRGSIVDRCPLCRSDVNILGIDSLPNDLKLTQLFAMLNSALTQLRQQPTTGAVMEVACDLCRMEGVHSYAQWKCVQCGNMCSTCNQWHQNAPRLSSHKVHPLSGPQLTIEEVFTCQEHMQAFISTCKQCDRLLCTNCFLTKCSGHDILDIKSASDIYRSQLTKEKIKLRNNINIVTELIDNLSKLIVDTDATMQKKQIERTSSLSYQPSNYMFTHKAPPRTHRMPSQESQAATQREIMHEYEEHKRLEQDIAHEMSVLQRQFSVLRILSESLNQLTDKKYSIPLIAMFKTIQVTSPGEIDGTFMSYFMDAKAKMKVTVNDRIPVIKINDKESLLVTGNKDRPKTALQKVRSRSVSDTVREEADESKKEPVANGMVDSDRPIPAPRRKSIMRSKRRASESLSQTRVKFQDSVDLEVEVAQIHVREDCMEATCLNCSLTLAWECRGLAYGWDVTFLPLDNIAVSDYATGRVIIYSSDGIMHHHADRVGIQMTAPRGLVYNHSIGSLAVCDSSEAKIQYLDTNRLKRQGGISPIHTVSPHGLVVNAAGHFVVTDIGQKNTISIHNENGECLKLWNLRFPGDRTNQPYYVALDHNDRIIASDMANSSIKIYTQDGKTISTFGRLQLRNFIRPGGVAVTNLNNILIVHGTKGGGDRITAFSPEGRLLGTVLKADGKMGELRSVAMEKNMLAVLFEQGIQMFTLEENI